MANPNPCPEARFKPGNPGKPVGAVSRTTLLKEKLLKAALEIDLNGGRRIFNKKGKCLVIPDISRSDIMKLAAGFVPKEQVIKGEGFETNITLANVLGGGEIDPAARQELIACLRKGRSEGQSV